MTGRERVRRALDFERPDRAPRDLWFLPGVAMYRCAELDAMLLRYPLDLSRAPDPSPPSSRASGAPHEVGSYIDGWGCEWVAAEPGVIGEVKNPPLADWSALEDWSPPYDALDNANWDIVKPYCKETDSYVLSASDIKPFERIQSLRGSQQVFIDLAMGEPEFGELCRQVHEWNLRCAKLWCKTDVDGFSFLDDWGSQSALLIAPEMWREIFKPMYAEYCAIARAHGKRVFMHSDGVTESIIPDLIEIGVDAFNTQIFLMDIEDLAARFKGKLTFWGEIDRQRLLPFGAPEDVRAAVRRVRNALDDGGGGLIAQCEWGNADPAENIEAVFEAWLEDPPRRRI